LRKRMLEDMQLKGFSERTQQCYLRAVRKLAQHYNKPPDQISEEELRNYFLTGTTAPGRTQPSKTHLRSATPLHR
ncbi:phage integrase N-terminal SAM-like domain-containing protein, partial [bacterium]|nr:phage integrase N-terminal SAM-like domain-containing protein [bacterium]